MCVAHAGCTLTCIDHSFAQLLNHLVSQAPHLFEPAGKYLNILLRQCRVIVIAVQDALATNAVRGGQLLAQLSVRHSLLQVRQSQLFPLQQQQQRQAGAA